MLSPTHLEKLMLGLRQTMDFSQLEEITLEANPATFDLTKAKLFCELGISRVSLGIQSFAPHVLATLGREHDPDQAMRSVEILHEAQMPSINIDLMFSIPGQSHDDWQASLRQAIAVKPHHISAYNLTYEEDTAFFQSLLSGEMHEDIQRDSDHFQTAHDLLTAAGFDHYETSNYATPGHHSIHNRGYWRGESYIGLGPSAVSTINSIRSKNIPDTAQYIEMMATIGHATAESETLGEEDLRLERIALGLRTKEGIPMQLLDETGEKRTNDLIALGLVTINDQQLTVTDRGRALVDAIAGEIA